MNCYKKELIAEGRDKEKKFNSTCGVYRLQACAAVYPWIGSLEGSPAFRGNFFPVGLIFLIFTNERLISLPGSWNTTGLFCVPPRTCTAVFAAESSSTISPDL